jgi:dipeptidase E
MHNVKLFLYSCYMLAPAHREALHRLVGKPAEEITFAAIENALDVEQDTQGWISDSRNAIAVHPAQIEVVDLRKWRTERAGLRELLASKDVIWLYGGNGFYLRWILKESGADEIIRELIAQGTVYAGWSAGAVLAGPTLQYFELVEDLTVVPEVHYDALNLTDVAVCPHMDLPEFADGMAQVERQLRQAGIRTAPLTEAMALMIDGNVQQIMSS